MKERNRLKPGQKRGRLTLIRRSESKPKSWECLCDCGNHHTTLATLLCSGGTRSCGCLRKEVTSAQHAKHGMSETRIYNVWGRMVQRCTNPNVEKFPDYGGRGIRVCERWMVAANFIADMDPLPPGMSLERIDNDGNYEPSNCRWATKREQLRNTRRTRFVELNGIRKSLADWVEEFGAEYAMVRERLDRGWEPIRALTEKKHGT